MSNRKRARKQDMVPTWLAVAVVLIGAFAVSIPMYSAFVLYGISTMPPSGTGTAALYAAPSPIGSTSSACFDSDGGPNLAVQGTCRAGGVSKTDYCYNSVSVVEYQCGAGRCTKNLFNCLNYGFSGCQNGACVLNTTNNTHLECVSLACTSVAGAGADLCHTNADCNNNTNESHLACVGLTCSTVSGGGANLCNTNADCSHLACVGLTCSSVVGGGANLCNSNADCNNNTNQSHLACVGLTCTTVTGAGTNLCNSNADCYSSYCGDGICNGNETNITCSQDCGNITHLACVSNACTPIAGAGNDTCHTNNDCQTHLECINYSCSKVSGAGTDLCTPFNSTCGNNSYPDLTVISFSSSNGNKTGNQTNVTLTATVKNIGVISAGSSTTRFAIVNISGTKDVFTVSLAPGAQTTIWTTFLLSAGTYNATATADIFNVVTESDETNNVRSLTFNV